MVAGYRIGEPLTQLCWSYGCRQCRQCVLQRLRDGIELVNILLDKVIVDRALYCPSEGKQQSRYDCADGNSKPYSQGSWTSLHWSVPLVHIKHIANATHGLNELGLIIVVNF